MNTEKTPANKTPKNNPLSVSAERADYRNRRILGFWHSASSPVFQQVLGPDLSRELDARLETSDPWRDDKEERKDGEKAFICRLEDQCGLVVKILDILSTRPEGMALETAIDQLGQSTDSRDILRTLAAFLELGQQRIIDAGTVEFCDTIAEIHNTAHGGLPGMVVLDITSILGGMAPRDD